MSLAKELLDKADRLRRGDDGGGDRDFLAGRPVHCGTQLRLWRGGEWVWTRYEMTGSSRRGCLYLVGANGRDEVIWAADHRLRWPESWEQ